MVTGKSHIKHLSINYCKHRNKSKCTSILTNLVAHLKTHVDSGRLSLLPIYLSTLSRLNALDCEVQMQARARWAEEDESSTAFFSALRRNGLRIVIYLRAGDGSLVMDKAGLSNLLSSFYLDLVTAVSCDSSFAHFFCSAL